MKDNTKIKSEKELIKNLPAVSALGYLIKQVNIYGFHELPKDATLREFMEAGNCSFSEELLTALPSTSEIYTVYQLGKSSVVLQLSFPYPKTEEVEKRTYREAVKAYIYFIKKALPQMLYPYADYYEQLLRDFEENGFKTPKYGESLISSEGAKVLLEEVEFELAIKEQIDVFF